MSILIKGMEMPTGCAECPFEMYYFNTGETRCRATNKTLETSYRPATYEERDLDCPLVPVPEHGRLIDADALIADLKRQCKEVFRIDAVSPDDFWITRNAAYNERLWTTWCESLYDYINAAPAVIEAEEGE